MQSPVYCGRNSNSSFASKGPIQNIKHDCTKSAITTEIDPTKMCVLRHPKKRVVVADASGKCQVLDSSRKIKALDNNGCIEKEFLNQNIEQLKKKSSKEQMSNEVQDHDDINQANNDKVLSTPEAQQKSNLKKSKRNLVRKKRHQACLESLQLVSLPIDAKYKKTKALKQKYASSSSEKIKSGHNDKFEELKINKSDNFETKDILDQFKSHTSTPQIPNGDSLKPQMFQELKKVTNKTEKICESKNLEPIRKKLNLNRYDYSSDDEENVSNKQYKINNRIDLNRKAYEKQRNCLSECVTQKNVLDKYLPKSYKLTMTKSWSNEMINHNILSDIYTRNNNLSKKSRYCSDDNREKLMVPYYSPNYLQFENDQNSMRNCMPQNCCRHLMSCFGNLDAELTCTKNNYLCCVPLQQQMLNYDLFAKEYELNQEYVFLHNLERVHCWSHILREVNTTRNLTKKSFYLTAITSLFFYLIYIILDINIPEQFVKVIVKTVNSFRYVDQQTPSIFQTIIFYLNKISSYVFYGDW